MNSRASSSVYVCGDAVCFGVPVSLAGTAWVDLTPEQRDTVNVCWEGDSLTGEWVVRNNTRGGGGAKGFGSGSPSSPPDFSKIKYHPTSANQVDEREAVRMMLAKEGEYSGWDGIRKCIGDDTQCRQQLRESNMC